MLAVTKKESRVLLLNKCSCDDTEEHTNVASYLREGIPWARSENSRIIKPNVNPFGKRGLKRIPSAIGEANGKNLGHVSQLSGLEID
jgi:hypothetical protein